MTPTTDVRERPIPALSIQQPWAWLIVNGHKDVENRGWYTKVRGTIAIHAGKSVDEDGYAWVRRMFPDIAMPPLMSMQRGGIVGRATLVDCVERHPSRWFQGPRGFVLEEAASVPFVACSGKLGFFPSPKGAS